MGTVADLYNSLKKVDIDKLSKQSIAQTADKIAALNVNQLSKGQRSDDVMMPDYSNASIMLFHKPPGPIRLFETGTFWKSIKVDVGSEVLTTIADDPNNLQKRFGQNIFGMNTASHEFYVNQVFLPLLQEKIQKLTGLEFN